MAPQSNYMTDQGKRECTETYTTDMSLHDSTRTHIHIHREKCGKPISFWLIFTVDENKDSFIQHRMTCKTVNRR